MVHQRRSIESVWKRLVNLNRVRTALDSFDEWNTPRRAIGDVMSPRIHVAQLWSATGHKFEKPAAKRNCEASHSPLRSNEFTSTRFTNVLLAVQIISFFVNTLRTFYTTPISRFSSEQFSLNFPINGSNFVDSRLGAKQRARISPIAQQ